MLAWASGKFFPPASGIHQIWLSLGMQPLQQLAQNRQQGRSCLGCRVTDDFFWFSEQAQTVAVAW